MLKTLTKQNETPLVVSEKVAANMLGISSRTLFQMRKDGKIKHNRLGRRVVYSIEMLKQFLLKNEQDGKGEEAIKKH